MDVAFRLDHMTIVWTLLIALLIVGVVLLVQLTRFISSLIGTAKRADETIGRANDLIDEANKLVGQATEITERANNSYKQVNSIIDYATTGISNFVVSKFDKK